MVAECGGRQAHRLLGVLRVGQCLQMLVERSQGREGLALGVGELGKLLAQSMQFLVLPAQLSQQGINVVLQGVALVVRHAALTRPALGQGGGLLKGVAKQGRQLNRVRHLTIEIVL